MKLERCLEMGQKLILHTVSSANQGLRLRRSGLDEGEW